MRIAVTTILLIFISFTSFGQVIIRDTLTCIDCFGSNFEHIVENNYLISELDSRKLDDNLISLKEVKEKYKGYLKVIESKNSKTSDWISLNAGKSRYEFGAMPFDFYADRNDLVLAIESMKFFNILSNDEVNISEANIGFKFKTGQSWSTGYDLVSNKNLIKDLILVADSMEIRIKMDDINVLSNFFHFPSRKNEELIYKFK